MENPYNGRLTSLRPLFEWHAHHLRQGGVLFPTYSSLKWFIRQHGEELRNAGVLLSGAGSRTNLVTPDFGKCVYQIFFAPQDN